MPHGWRGVSALRIENGTTSDAGAVLLTSGGGCLAVYIRAGESATIESIPPVAYTLRFMFGTEWTGQNFARDQDFFEFENTFAFQERKIDTGWEFVRASVTLHKVARGNAPARTIPPFKVPQQR